MDVNSLSFKGSDPNGTKISQKPTPPVIPANARIQRNGDFGGFWIPAFAGKTAVLDLTSCHSAPPPFTRFYGETKISQWTKNGCLDKERKAKNTLTPTVRSTRSTTSGYLPLPATDSQQLMTPLKGVNIRIP